MSTPTPHQPPAEAVRAAEEAIQELLRIHALKFAPCNSYGLAAIISEQTALPQLLEDKARLDWLIAQSAYLSHSRDGEVCNVWFSYDPKDESNGPIPVQGYPQKCYLDPREAIDQARRALAQQEKGETKS